MSEPLWFFWGQSSLSFLRWLTLLSATRVHPDVRLIVRQPLSHQGISWEENQECVAGAVGSSIVDDYGDIADYITGIGVTVVDLTEIAPQIAEMQLPDIQTSDILAWWLLAEYGGTVADMDILFIRPLPQITCDVQVVMFNGYPRCGYIPVSFMQGRPNPIWRRAYGRAKVNIDPLVYESCGSACLEVKSGSLPDTIVFPWAGTAHRWSTWHRFLFESNEWPAIPNDCCGLHWYAGHNQKWNRAITKEGDLRRGALAHYAKEVMASAHISC